jgi:protein-S-isoprenylcysteine O-methyltransferase Ste14
MLPNWVAGPSTLVPFAFMYFLRTPLEEQMMLRHFGQDYSDYMERTGRIFPRVTSATRRSGGGG